MRGYKILMKKYRIIACCAAIVAASVALNVQARKAQKIEPSYAWTISDPLGLHYESTIDTLPENYHATAVPSLISKAWATTGNYGAEGQNQIFFQRPITSEFFFEDALSNWLPTIANQRYYNTRIPMTMLSYITGGDKYSNQDRTTGVFSGNVNKAIEVGAAMDYIYSKGSYDYQADKDFTWRLFGSYIGDRYEFQGFINNYNFLNKENGGITDDRYITDPAAVQGGDTKVDNKSIPTKLTASHSRVVGHEVYMNHRYKVGFYRYKRDSVTDTVISKTYVPVTSFIWTFDYKTNNHKYINQSGKEDTSFYSNTYLGLGGTDDVTKYWKVRNTVGISMLEGFNKYAKFGFAVYGTHEYRNYTQAIDSISGATTVDSALTKMPAVIAHSHHESLFWVGGQLTKQRGSLLRYDATAQFGVAGDVAGDMDISGDVYTRFKMLGDSVTIKGYGYFKNLEAPYFLKNFVSNHFVWHNDFDKIRRFRAGGELDIPFTHTNINVGYETLKNYVYFGTDALPAQHGAPIHVLNATLNQNFNLGILHNENSVTYQTTSNEDVLALPKISVYSNLYLKFIVAHVFHVQLGVDCNYYSKYYAPNYNPSTMTFYNQRDKKCGNFAFMNAYANMKLKRARFFVMYSHFNQGMFGGDDYFSIPHYPLNPHRFQMGVSVDFAN